MLEVLDDIVVVVEVEDVVELLEVVVEVVVVEVVVELVVVVGSVLLDVVESGVVGDVVFVVVVVLLLVVDGGGDVVEVLVVMLLEVVVLVVVVVVLLLVVVDVVVELVELVELVEEVVEVVDVVVEVLLVELVDVVAELDVEVLPRVVVVLLEVVVVVGAMLASHPRAVTRRAPTMRPANTPSSSARRLAEMTANGAHRRERMTADRLTMVVRPPTNTGKSQADTPPSSIGPRIAPLPRTRSPAIRTVAPRAARTRAFRPIWRRQKVWTPGSRVTVAPAVTTTLEWAPAGTACRVPFAPRRVGPDAAITHGIWFGAAHSAPRSSTGPENGIGRPQLPRPLPVNSRAHLESSANLTLLATTSEVAAVSRLRATSVPWFTPISPRRMVTPSSSIASCANRT